MFSDEFTGSSLNTSKWNARNNTRVDYDLACITSRPENVSVSGGMLTLRARKETATCGSATRDYTVAYLDTIGKASFTYGKFAMRAKSPNGPTNSTGLWPAFWLRPNDGGNGELDVVELPGGAPTTRRPPKRSSVTTRRPSRTTATVPSGFPGDGFHVYTTEWTSTDMRWYIDGNLAYQRDTDTTPWFAECFRKPLPLAAELPGRRLARQPDHGHRAPSRVPGGLHPGLPTVTHRSPHSVVGTLCPMKEGTASQMTRTFYEHLATSRGHVHRRGGRTTQGNPAIRITRSAVPTAWAAFVHAGA